MISPNESMFLNISTHTPLARRDTVFQRRSEDWKYFYSHASREAWLFITTSYPCIILFLLTRLSRGVTIPWQWALKYSLNFYSHASREAWREYIDSCKEGMDFYSHASREAWRNRSRSIVVKNSFLLTRLSRGVTAIFSIIHVYTPCILRETDFILFCFLYYTWKYDNFPGEPAAFSQSLRLPWLK